MANVGPIKELFKNIYIWCKFCQNKVVVWAVELTVCKILYFTFFYKTCARNRFYTKSHNTTRSIFEEIPSKSIEPFFNIETRFFGVKELLNVIPCTYWLSKIHVQYEFWQKSPVVRTQELDVNLLNVQNKKKMPRHLIDTCLEVKFIT